MLRVPRTSFRVQRITSAFKTFSTFAGDADTAGTASDVVRAFMAEHQINVKGGSGMEYQPFLSFDQTPFSVKLKNVMKKENFQSPSPIQAISWPIVLQNKDVISVAKTGSGKTLGYLLPGFHKILTKKANTPNIPGRRQRLFTSPEVLVLAPTRELGTQIASEASKYSAANINTVCVYGGASKAVQLNLLRKGADCVVGTPGRAIDLINEGAIDLSEVKYVVLDEADRMLDMGFEPQIRDIIDQLPTAAEGRQTLFFTATWPREVQKLAAEFLHDPMQINIGDQNQLNANKDIKQNIMIVKEFHKMDALLDLFEHKINLSDNPRALPKTIVFSSTKANCDTIQKELRRAGYSAVALHGDKSQHIRDSAMQSFRSGQVNVLIATDIAARGLDVKDIENVVNFSFPNNTEDYVHRIGRTGRAGAKGTAYTFLNAKDMENRRNMSDLVGVLTRCDQEVPALLENYRKGSSLHSEERTVSFRGRAPRTFDRKSGGNFGDRGFSRDGQRGRGSFGGDRNGGGRGGGYGDRNGGGRGGGYGGGGRGRFDDEFDGEFGSRGRGGGRRDTGDEFGSVFGSGGRGLGRGFLGGAAAEGGGFVRKSFGIGSGSGAMGAMSGFARNSAPPDAEFGRQSFLRSPHDGFHDSADHDDMEEVRRTLRSARK